MICGVLWCRVVLCCVLLFCVAWRGVAECACLYVSRQGMYVWRQSRQVA